MKRQQVKIVVYIAIISLVIAMLIQQSNAQGSLSTSEQKFRAQVEKLKDMGFKDGKRNKKLINLVYSLVSNDGNVYKALKQLHF